MVAATRTLGPLHFEDLEPHRFEDLVRALVYDFRPWLKLEGTGRVGSDDGFDIRGWEAFAAQPSIDETGEEPEQPDFLRNSRLWLIQCKREKSISPKKLITYLDAISDGGRSDLDGLIFAAACDFSKKSQDDFRAWCQSAGIGEYYLWGKAELENELLRPQNDGLLFAFFGISLIVRKRSLRTEIRSIIATKKKIIKLAGIGEHAHKTCLFRDPTDDRYPIAPGGMLPITPGKGLNYGWFVRDIIGAFHDGILVRMRDAMAYLADDDIHWDYIPDLSDNAANYFQDPWSPNRDDEEISGKAYAARYYWANLAEQNRARWVSDGFIPYDAILAIDDDGDGTVRIPTIFVQFDAERGPFKGGRGYVFSGDRRVQDIPINRIRFFPNDFPTPPERIVNVQPDSG